MKAQLDKELVAISVVIDPVRSKLKFLSKCRCACSKLTLFEVLLFHL